MAGKRESQLRDTQFAFVFVRDGKTIRKERIDDAGHVRNAIARFRQVKDVSDAERDKAWRRIKRAAERFGVTVSESSWRDLKAAHMTVRARSASVELPVTNAPNRTPFAGILCVLDEPSTRPPEGSGGRCVILPRELAEKLVPTLIGQAVDWKPTLDGHDVQCKVGVITAAEVRDDPELGKPVIAVAGILYDQDFPDLVPAIRKHLGEVGMSFELGAELGDGPTEGTASILDSSGFTGAAILLRRDAAYHTTRLAAGREKERKDAMSVTMEQLTAALAGFKTEVLGSVGDIIKTAVQAAKKKSGKERLTDDLKDLHDMHAKAGELHADMLKKITEFDPDDDEADTGAMQAAAEKLGEHLKATSKHVKSMKADDYMSAEEGVKGAAATPPANQAADPKVAELETKLAAQAAEIASLNARANGQTRENSDPGRQTIHPALSILVAKGDLKIKAAGEEGEDPRPTVSEVRAALDKAGIKDEQTRFAALAAARDD